MTNPLFTLSTVSSSALPKAGPIQSVMEVAREVDELGQQNFYTAARTLRAIEKGIEGEAPLRLSFTSQELGSLDSIRGGDWTRREEYRSREIAYFFHRLWSEYKQTPYGPKRGEILAKMQVAYEGIFGSPGKILTMKDYEKLIYDHFAIANQKAILEEESAFVDFARATGQPYSMEDVRMVFLLKRGSITHAQLQLSELTAKRRLGSKQEFTQIFELGLRCLRLAEWINTYDYDKREVLKVVAQAAGHLHVASLYDGDDMDGAYANRARDFEVAAIKLAVEISGKQRMVAVPDGNINYGEGVTVKDAYNFYLSRGPGVYQYELDILKWAGDKCFKMAREEGVDGEDQQDALANMEALYLKAVTGYLGLGGVTDHHYIEDIMLSRLVAWNPYIGRIEGAREKVDKAISYLQGCGHMPDTLCIMIVERYLVVPFEEGVEIFKEYKSEKNGTKKGPVPLTELLGWLEARRKGDMQDTGGVEAVLKDGTPVRVSRGLKEKLDRRNDLIAKLRVKYTSGEEDELKRICVAVEKLFVREVGGVDDIEAIQRVARYATEAPSLRDVSPSISAMVNASRRVIETARDERMADIYFVNKEYGKAALIYQWLATKAGDNELYNKRFKTLLLIVLADAKWRRDIGDAMGALEGYHLVGKLCKEAKRELGGFGERAARVAMLRGAMLFGELQEGEKPLSGKNEAVKYYTGLLIRFRDREMMIQNGIRAIGKEDTRFQTISEAGRRQIVWQLFEEYRYRNLKENFQDWIKNAIGPYLDGHKLMVSWTRNVGRGMDKRWELDRIDFESDKALK